MMSNSLEASEAQIGFTAFTLNAIFALSIVGVVSNLYGRQAVVMSGPPLFSVAGKAIGFTTDFRQILLLGGSGESAAQGSQIRLNRLTGFAGPAASATTPSTSVYC